MNTPEDKDTVPGHLAGLKLVPKSEVETMEEAGKLIDKGLFGPDEGLAWACEYKGSFFAGGVVQIVDRKVVNAPEWATHIQCWW